MTVREIASDARMIMATNPLNSWKELLLNHIEVANQKIKEFSVKTNKQLGTHRSAPRINTISDFNRFK
jgi:malate/lactate dehydrogenase